MTNLSMQTSTLRMERSSRFYYFLPIIVSMPMIRSAPTTVIIQLDAVLQSRLVLFTARTPVLI